MPDSTERLKFLKSRKIDKNYDFLGSLATNFNEILNFLKSWKNWLELRFFLCLSFVADFAETSKKFKW